MMGEKTMNKLEMMAGMESKLVELEKALADVQAKHEDIASAKMSGGKAVTDMLQKRTDLKESIQRATDLGEAKLLMQQVEDLEKDAQLQGIVNKGTDTKLKEELAELFNTLYVVNASARNMYAPLDKAYVLDMSINTSEETVQAMADVAERINSVFNQASRLLLANGLVEQKDNFFNGRTIKVHLTGYPLVTKGKEMQRAMAQLKRQYSLDV